MHQGIRSFSVRTLAGFAATVLVATLAACGSSDEATTAGGSGDCDIPDGPIKIGSVLPLSGPFAALGATNDKGTDIAVKAFNENSDICGHKVERVRADDQGDPATAVSLGRKLTSDGVSMFIDAGRGETGEAITPLLMKEGAIVISDVGFGYRFDVEKFPTFYGVNPTNEQYMTKVAAHIEDKGWKKIGVLTDGLTGGKELTELITESLKEDGNPVVETVTYSPTAIDLSSQIQELKGAGVETLVYAGTSNLGNIIKSLKISGWEPNLAGIGLMFGYGIQAKDVPAGTTDLCYLYLPADQAPEGTGDIAPVTLAVMEEAAKKIGEFNPGIDTAHQAYGRLLVAKAAIEKAGTLDRKELKKAMDSLTDVPIAWPGISVSFTPDDHAGYPDDKLSVCQIQVSKLAVRYEAE